MLGTWHIIWNLIDFLVLLFLIKTFLSKPIANAIKGKQEAISSTLNDVERRLNEVNKKLDSQSSQLGQIKDEISKIEQQAQNMATKLKDDIVRSAHNEAEKLREQIKRNMEQDVNKTRSELKKEVTDKALLKAQEIVNQKLDMVTQIQLIKDFAMSLDSKSSVN